MSGNLFSGGNKETEEVQKKVDTHTKAIFTVVERQKHIEDSIESLSDRNELIYNNFNKLEKESSKKNKSLREDIKQIKEDLENLKDFAIKVKKELGIIAKKSDVDVLKKYIDLWNPMDFATKDDLESIKKEITDIVKDVLK